MSRFRQFIKESWSELKKVSWPSRLQVRNLTVLVFAVSFFVGVYITVADTFYTEIVKLLTTLATGLA